MACERSKMDMDNHAGNNFKRLLECTICLEQYKDPRMLSCQHTYCFKCLQPMPTQNRHITCPVCRGKTLVPEGGLENLPKSMLVDGILGSLCPSCWVNVKTLTCPHCHEKICQICKVSHITELRETVKQILGSLNDDSDDTVSRLRTVVDKLRIEGQSRIERVFQNCMDILKEQSAHLKAELEEKLKELQPQCNNILKYEKLSEELTGRSQQMEDQLEGQMSDEDVIIMYQECEGIEQIRKQVKDFKGRVEVVIDEDRLYSTLRNMGRVSLVADGSSETLERLVGSNEERTPTVVNYRTIGAVKRVLFTRGSGREQLLNPARVSVSPLNGDILVADTGNNRIQVIDREYKHRMIIGSGPGRGIGEFSGPKGVVVLADGSIAVADVGNNRIQVFSATGQYRYTFGTAGSQPGQLHGPITLATDRDGQLYVCDWDNHRVQVFTAAGAFVRVIGSYGKGPGQFNHPGFVTINTRGEVIVSDTWNNRLQVFSPEGAFKFIIGKSSSDFGSFHSPLGIVTDDDCNIIVSDFGNNRIQIFNQHGEFLACFGSAGFGAGQFNRPAGLAVTRQGDVVVCDYSNHRIQVF